MRDVATRWTSSVAALAFAVALATTAPALAQTDLVPPSIVGQPPALDLPPLASGVEEEARRVARRATPEALRARQESRTAHRNLSDSEALALAERLFPAATTKPTWTPPALAPGDELGPFEGDFARWVMHGPGKRPSIVDSEIPLRVEDESGAKRDVSFALEESATAFKPANPHVPVRLPKRLSDGAALTGADVAVVPDASATPTPKTVGGKLFYPNADRNTDIVLAPHPRGLETFHVLRADSAPRRLGLDFRLPAGAELAPAPGGIADGAQVVKGARTLATVRAPEATDADGAPVPVRYDIRGKRLSLEVDHRQGDYRYPILVDPVVEDQNRWNTNSSIDFRGWRYYRNGTLFNAQSGRYGRGLYINRDPTYMQNGQYGEWYYQAPGDAFVYRAEFLDGHHDDQGSSCVTEYVSGGDGAQMCGGGHNLNRTFCTRDNCAVDGPRGNYMAFRFGFSGDMQVTRNVGGFLGGARVYMHDTNAPSLDQPVAQVDPGTGAGVAEPTGWTRQRTWATRFTGRDGGLGVKRHRVENASGAIVGEKLYTGCTAQCPQVLTQTVPYTLPDGLHSLRARVRDNPDHPSALSAAWERRVDATAPTVTTTGTLKDSQADWLRDGTKRSLRIDARDEDPSGPRAGVGSLKVEVDGKTVEPTSTCAQDSCRLVRDFSFDPAVYGDGRHTVAVTTTDRAGNVSSQSYAVKVDRGGPALKLSGSLKEAENTPVMEESYELQAEASDPGAGVKSVEILVDGIRKRFDEQSCAAGACPTSRSSSLTFDPAEYARGEHVIEVKSIDGFDQASSQSFKVSTGPRTGDLPRYEFERFQLDEGFELAVNAGNGNALLKQTGFAIEETDLDYTVDHYYNGLSDLDSAVGRGGWSLGAGGAARLTSLEGGSVTLDGPSGYGAAFVRRGDGTFKSPAGVDQDLTKQSDGTFKLTLADTEDELTFDDAGLPMARLDQGGRSINYEHDGQGRLTSIADTEGRRTTFGYDDKGLLSTMVDPGDRQHSYAHDLLGNLSSYTAPDGRRTTFAYDPLSKKLVGTTGPSGSLTRIGYDAQGRVTSVKRGVNPLTLLGGSETTFRYEGASTIASADQGPRTSYSFDRALMAVRVQRGTGPPSLDLTGSLSEQAGQALQDGETYELGMAASDGGPLRNLEVTVDGETAHSADAVCRNGCGSLTRSWTFDVNDYLPGEYVVRVAATDAAGDALRKVLRVIVPPKPAIPPMRTQTDDPEPPEADVDADVSASACETDFGAGSAMCGPSISGGEVAPAADRRGGSMTIVPAVARSAATTPGVAVASEFRRLVVNPVTQVEFGIADQKPAIARDDDYAALGVRTVRYGVPWDIVTNPAYSARLASFRAWYADHMTRDQMFVAFDSDSTAKKTRGPSIAAYMKAIKAFKSRFPGVDAYSPWNEPNFSTEPTTSNKRANPFAEGPRLLAKYTNMAQRALCKRGSRYPCAIVAGDLAQLSKSELRYEVQFRDALKSFEPASRRQPLPRIWALHPYQDGLYNYSLRTSRASAFIKRAPATARIWFSEVGAFLTRDGVAVNDLQGQAQDESYLVNQLSLLRRVDRMYHYYFCNTTGTPPDDTSLLDTPEGSPEENPCGDVRRPAYETFAKAAREGRHLSPLQFDP
jgi:YD repeat-containing protein